MLNQAFTIEINFLFQINFCIYNCHMNQFYDVRSTQCKYFIKLLMFIDITKKLH